MAYDIAEKAAGEVIGQAQVKLIWIAIFHTGATTVATIAIAIAIIARSWTDHPQNGTQKLKRDGWNEMDGKQGRRYNVFCMWY